MKFVELTFLRPFKNLKKFNTSLCIRSVVAHLHFPEARSRAWLILLIAAKERFRERMGEKGEATIRFVVALNGRRCTRE